MSQTIFRVAIWTDGLGSFQARCMECDWVGPWRESGNRATRNARAVSDSKAHGAAHQTDEARAAAMGASNE